MRTEQELVIVLKETVVDQPTESITVTPLGRSRHVISLAITYDDGYLNKINFNVGQSNDPDSFVKAVS